MLLFALSGSAFAQVQPVNRTINGQPDSNIRVGVYVNIKPDCTSGPLPSIQLTSPPEHGKVTVKQGKVTATNYKQCLALEVSAFIAFYRSRSSSVAPVKYVTRMVPFCALDKAQRQRHGQL